MKLKEWNYVSIIVFSAVRLLILQHKFIVHIHYTAMLRRYTSASTCDNKLEVIIFRQIGLYTQRVSESASNTHSGVGVWMFECKLTSIV